MAGLTMAGPAQAADRQGAGESIGGVTAEVGGGFVEADWADVGGAVSYLVIDEREHKVLWSGKESQAKVPLRTGNSADLLVAAVGKDSNTSVTRILATNPPAGTRLEPLVSVSTPAGTLVSWQRAEGVRSYQVAGGGLGGQRSLSADSATLSVRSTRVLGQEGRIEVIGQTPIPKSREERQPPGQRYGVELTAPSTRLSQVSAAAKPGDAVPFSPTGITSTVTDYETFIPSRYLDAPESWTDFPCEGELFGPDYWYSGDNRQVGHGTGKYRTRAASYRFWTAPGSDWTSERISPTNRYIRVLPEDGGWAYDSTRTADGDDFDVRNISNDGSYARTVIEHDVGNPYCTSLAGITYANQQDLYQNGGHYIYGSHDKMPDHQFYRTDYYGPEDETPVESLIFHHELEDPNCLVGVVCGSWRYQYVR
ncbi:hypothetical protein [Streptomyces sp. KR55]|uniref:hypothetical protein n=1 Tax=Streptomyces sp. KR55 TaxID=3457425 RepID=UPI003FD59556